MLLLLAPEAIDFALFVITSALLVNQFESIAIINYLLILIYLTQINRFISLIFAKNKGIKILSISVVFQKVVNLSSNLVSSDALFEGFSFSDNSLSLGL